MNTNENLFMLQQTIQECDTMAQASDVREDDILVSPSEDEMKLFWSVTSSLKMSA